MNPDNHNEARQVNPEEKNRLDRKLKRIADALSKHVNRLPARSLRVILLCIGTAGAAICFTLVIRPRAGRVTITKTQPSIIRPKLEQNDAPSMSKQDYLNLIRIKKTLDSLSHSPKDSMQVTQWLRQNPGFVDSLNFILEFYQPKDFK